MIVPVFAMLTMLWLTTSITYEERGEVLGFISGFSDPPTVVSIDKKIDFIISDKIAQSGRTTKALFSGIIAFIGVFACLLFLRMALKPFNYGAIILNDQMQKAQDRLSRKFLNSRCILIFGFLISIAVSIFSSALYEWSRSLFN